LKKKSFYCSDTRDVCDEPVPKFCQSSEKNKLKILLMLLKALLTFTCLGSLGIPTQGRSREYKLRGEAQYN